MGNVIRFSEIRPDGIGGLMFSGQVFDSNTTSSTSAPVEVAIRVSSEEMAGKSDAEIGGMAFAKAKVDAENIQRFRPYLNKQFPLP